MRESYLLIFGNVPDSLSTYNTLHTIAVVAGSFLLPIFFINFLIAKLTNAYEDVEERQRPIAMRESAELLWEYEKMIRYVLKTIGTSKQSSPGYVFLIVNSEEDKERLSFTKSSDYKKISKELRKSSKLQSNQIEESHKQLMEEIGQNNSQINSLGVELSNQMTEIRKISLKLSRINYASKKLTNNEESSPKNQNPIPQNINVNMI